MDEIDNYKTIQNFFTAVNTISKSLYVDNNISTNSSSINNILRPYQMETVKWMLHREMFLENIKLGDYNVSLPLGGILADEMGLGKTIEMLACLVNHRKTIPSSNEDCVIENTNNFRIKLEKKRKSSFNSTESFMNSLFRKRPRLDLIEINRTLRNKLRNLLESYFMIFQKTVLFKNSVPVSDESNMLFKILLLNRIYDQLEHDYSKSQIWGFLITEYDIDRVESTGYSILCQLLSENSDNNCSLYENSILSQITSFADQYLNEKLLKKFHKELKNIIAYSLYFAPTDITILEDETDVSCSCGGDRLKGEKIKCVNCNKMQHLECLGLASFPTGIKDYYCPYCWIKQKRIESSSTLIVVPLTLAKQWIEEIEKYTSDCNLNVYYYEGAKKAYIIPQLLASYDIVLVTFDVLRVEINRASEVIKTSARNLRHSKRYSSFTSPLTCINWWRLVIDEAQMVETPNKVSQMVSYFSAVNRWAVTGTPIGKSLHDLFGLMTYLNIDSLTESKIIWQTLLRNERCLLHELFAHIMRRRTKSEVIEQLGLPELKIEKTWISFTPIEGYFYNYTYTIAEDTFLKKIGKIENIDLPLKKAKNQTVESLLAPLTALREACIHPKVAHRGKSIFKMNRNSSMTEVLEKLIKKTKIQCEDTLRLYIMNINGAAGIKMKMHKYKEAVTLYRAVLTKTNDFEQIQYKNVYNKKDKENEYLVADVFQKLHALHNLYEASLHDSAIVLTEEENNIPEQIVLLERKQMEKKQNLITSSLQQVQQFSKKIEKCLGEIAISNFTWWEKIILALNFNEVKSRVEIELNKRKISCQNKIRFQRQLLSELEMWLLTVENKREVLFDYLNQLTNSQSTENLWKNAEICHIRKKEVKNSCIICSMNKWMTSYENILFNAKNENETETNSESDPVNWNISANECILHTLLLYYRSSYVYESKNPDYISAVAQVEALETFKREFKAIRATWTKICDLVHCYDELKMAKSRLYESEKDMEKLKSNRDLLLDMELNNYEAQCVALYTELQRKCGSLHYLANLSKRYSNQLSTNETDLIESCPVCHNSVDEKRAVLTCGHFTCYGCIMVLLNRVTKEGIQCPICRIYSSVSAISCVHGGAINDFDVSNVSGNYSIKILTITAKILNLKKENSNVKILLFSTWDRVLDEIEKAFIKNNIRFQRLSGKHLVNKAISTFKNDDVTVMLLRLNYGGKGLNLTEASHLIFTEPVLNIADEKQAVGRIDRLGQTRNMVVHKFIMRSTIEEHIMNMTEELQNNIDECELTFRHLRDLFVASSNNQIRCDIPIIDTY